jgi:hypothetical protein
MIVPSSTMATLHRPPHPRRDGPTAAQSEETCAAPLIDPSIHLLNILAQIESATARLSAGGMAR